MNFVKENQSSSAKQPSFRQQIKTNLLCFSLIPLLLFTLICSVYAHYLIKQSEEKSLSLLSQAGHQSLKVWFQQAQSRYSSFANSNFSQQLLVQFDSESLLDKSEQNIDGRFQQVESFLKLETYVENMIYIKSSGEMIYSWKERKKWPENVFLSEMNQTRLVANLKKSLYSGQPRFSDFELVNGLSGLPLGFMVFPQFDLDKRVTALMIVQFKTRPFNRFLNEQLNPDSHYDYLLISEDSDLRYSSQIERFQLPDFSLKNNWQQTIQENQIYRYSDSKNQHKLASYRRIQLFNESWVLAVEVVEGGEQGMMLISGIGIISLLGVCMIILAHYQSRAMATPMQSLVNSAELLVEGKVSQLIDHAENKEMDKLAKAFNLIQENLKRQCEALEESNEIAQEALMELTTQKFAVDQHTIVSVTDLQGTITLINEKFCQISGYSRYELIGNNHRIVNSGYHDESFFRQMYETIAEGDVWHGEICNKAKDGHLYWVDSTIVPTMNSDDKLESYIAIRTDITALKIQEAVIKEKSESLELVMENTGVGIWDWLILTGEISCNDRWAAIGGYKLDELQPLTMEVWTGKIHPDDLTRSSQMMERHFDGEVENYQCELRMRHKNGEWVWVLDSGRLVERDENGFPKRMIGTLVDISERKKAELEITEALAMTESTLESTDNGILVINEDGSIERRNAIFDEIWGLKDWEENLNESKCFEILNAQLVPGQSIQMKQIINQDHATSLLELKDKRIFEYSYKAMMISGTASGRVWRFRDITERKLAEAEMIKAKKAAEAANKAKSDFLANMSHEIRTPMNGVLGMTELLLDNPLEGEQQKRAHTIKRSAESLLTIINDILDFSKIEAGKLDLEFLEFNLTTLIEDLAESFASRTEEKHLEFICAANPDIPEWFRGDPGRIRQILTNLLGNAIKFTSIGEVSVSYRLIDKSCLRFEVTDSGIGLSNEQTAKLFKKFSQADSSTTRKFGGTGLGLAICKQLVELMEGEIGVTSQEGEGSTFWFTLKLEPIAVKTSIYQTKELGQQKILVVGDNQSNREVFEGFLRAWMIPHDSVSSASGAMQVLQSAHNKGEPFTQALIDMQMPGIDGESLGRMIRDDEKLSDLRLALLISQGHRGDARKMHECGFDAYLTKPIRQSELYSALIQLAGVKSDHPALVTRYTAKEHQPRFQANILVVDDNETNQVVAKGMLGKFGIEAMIANHGQEALEILADKPYDLVFMDCQMPVMDGYTATARIRDSQDQAINNDIPIIAMTANAMEGDKEKCLAADMDDFIAKPVDPVKLRKMLEKWLSHLLHQNQATDQESLQAESGEVSDADEIQEIPVFDYQALRERLMDDEELIRTLVDAFLGDMPGQIEDLKQMVAAENFDSATSQAHMIKGAAANIGAMALSEQAKIMEMDGKSVNFTEFVGNVAKIETVFEQLSIKIKETLA